MRAGFHHRAGRSQVVAEAVVHQVAGDESPRRTRRGRSASSRRHGLRVRRSGRATGTRGARAARHLARASRWPRSRRRGRCRAAPSGVPAVRACASPASCASAGRECDGLARRCQRRISAKAAVACAAAICAGSAAISAASRSAGSRVSSGSKNSVIAVSPLLQRLLQLGCEIAYRGVAAQAARLPLRAGAAGALAPWPPPAVRHRRAGVRWPGRVVRTRPRDLTSRDRAAPASGAARPLRA